MANIVQVQVIFKADTPKGPFSDALYFSEDEWAKVTPEDVEAQKQARVDKWLVYLDPPPPEPLTKEQLQGVKTELERQLSELSDQKASVEAEIATKV